MARRRRGEGIVRGGVACGWLVVLAFALVGCGKRIPEGMITVTGSVACGGQPLPKGALHFIPADARKSTSVRIDGNGRFRVAVWPLEYRIAVTADEHPAMVDDQGREIPAKSLVPLKYTSAATSGLTATVDASHTTVNIDLAP